ncbi:GGDEF domain-containing protein [Shewanella algae]|uniref:GGDEF domain-containing protein n=1 Tax=Shewanella algae TaxID=38313 RepID=UPI0031F59B7A
MALVICSCIISSCAILLISEMYAERAELVLQHQADTDTLTGLLNRRAFMRQVALQREQPGCWVLALLDLDFFKKINDNFGHDAGDVALIHVSKLLKKALKPQERLARIGGEEFALLLRLDEPGTQALQQRGEQLLESLRQQGLEYQSHYLQLTASVGLATLDPGDSASEALKQADKALYQAKINGRNRVELAGTVLQPLKRKSQS